MSKVAMIAHLTLCGWHPVRHRGEPVYFRDPLGCQEGLMRVESAFELQRRREASGVSRGAA